MKIAENAAMIPLARESGSPLYVVLVWDEKNLMLVDAGIPGQTPEIVKGIQDLGFRAENLTHMVITHQDYDHTGCITDLKKLAPGMKIIAHAEESPYIDGRRLPIKLEARLSQYHELPAAAKASVDAWKEMYEKTPIQITDEVHDGEVYDICGGVEFIHVPGHTPGHIAVYLKKSKIIICGDAANITDGRVAGSNPVHTHDMELAGESLKKITGCDLKGLVAYHGGFLDMGM